MTKEINSIGVELLKYFFILERQISESIAWVAFMQWKKKI